MFQPIIKWSGSKRSQAQEIIKHFPKVIDTYYEPFCGGASVLYELMADNTIRVNKFVCSDNNSDLINLWHTIIDDKDVLKETYTHLWHELNDKISYQDKKDYYNHIRNLFNNEKRNPCFFLFLNRTCFNGLIRYNSNGDFNTSFHLNRDGIHPDKFNKIIDKWNEVLLRNNVVFNCCSYENINPNENDFLYMDPPYAHTKGMYHEEFDNEIFFNYLMSVKCAYALSYDGLSGNENNLYSVPKELYDTHILIKSGNSSFKRIKESDRNAIVYESLYVKNIKK